MLCLYLQPCVTTTGSTSMQCMAPSLTAVEGVQFPVRSRIGLRMDGVESLLDLNTSVTIHSNPTIDEFETVLEFGQGNMIVLTITVSC